MEMLNAAADSQLAASQEIAPGESKDLASQVVAPGVSEDAQVPDAYEDAPSQVIPPAMVVGVVDDAQMADEGPS